MSRRRDEGQHVQLISYVTRRLLEGPKLEFLHLISHQYDVQINTRNGDEHNAHLTGKAENVREAAAFIERIDQKAKLIANENSLRNTAQVREREWSLMRVEITAALKSERNTQQHVSRKSDQRPVVQKTLSAQPLPAVQDAFVESTAPAAAPEGKRKNTAPAVKTASGFYPKNPSQAVGNLALNDEDVSVVILEGPAGGGKTHLAASHAVDVLRNYDRVLLFRPRTVTGKDGMGAMPGDDKEKMEFYTRPFANKIKEITGKPIDHFKKFERLTPDGERGESHVGALVIVDEAQNLTMAEAKMLLTRMAKGGKFIICGDISSDQNDIGTEMPGLAHIIATQAAKANRGDLVLQKGMAVISFSEDDSSARHPMMPSIIRAFNNPEPEYKELMDKITSFRRNAQLIQAIEEAVKYSRVELKTAAAATFERYEAAAKEAYPSVFGVNNVHRLPPVPEPAHRIA